MSEKKSDNHCGKTPKTRMLPGDFQKFVKAERAKNDEEEHYLTLSGTDKKVKRPAGFFPDPAELLGEQDVGERQFLVFYFDNKEDYAMALKYFAKPSKVKNQSHPNLDEQKLVQLLKNEEEG